MVRMFHIECDAKDHNVDSNDDLGDEWYADNAVELAKREGFHLRNYQAICPTCWDLGIRFKDIA
jgi:hypothetical protein